MKVALMLPMLVISALLLTGRSGPVESPLDTLIDVGGHRLHFVVYRGREPVTIVMESGGAATLEQWGGVAQQIATRTGATVVTYDRAGFGRSDPGPADLTPATQVQHLARALDRLGVPAKRIVLGASYGGLLAIAHADMHRDQVIGLVLVDPMNSRFVDATGDFVYSTVPHIAEPKNDNERAVARLVRTFGELVTVARRVEPGLQMPMVVITASRPVWHRAHENEEWRASHEALAAATGARRLIVAENAGHQIALDRPDVVVEAVLFLLNRKQRTTP